MDKEVCQAADHELKDDGEMQALHEKIERLATSACRSLLHAKLPGFTAL